MSNTETKHSEPVSESSDKSKKGEGVADTAKLKGTVSSDRPQVCPASKIERCAANYIQAENKEERGKSEQDKSK